MQNQFFSLSEARRGILPAQPWQGTVRAPPIPAPPLNDKSAPYREIPSRKTDRFFFAGTARNAPVLP